MMRTYLLHVPPTASGETALPLVLNFHGYSSTAEGGIGPTPSVAESFTGWAVRDGVELTLCTIEGGGHCWPGMQICTYGATTSDISVNAFGWNFLKRFSLP
jgi:poly(3-hydroxybutyrate) depolymerase